MTLADRVRAVCELRAALRGGATVAEALKVPEGLGAVGVALSGFSTEGPHGK